MTNKPQLSSPVLLTKFHDTSSFNCGVTALNTFLQNYALQNLQNRSVKTFVAVVKEEVVVERVVGYYSLVAGSVEHSAVPPRVKKGLGKYPIPVIILAVVSC